MLGVVSMEREASEAQAWTCSLSELVSFTSEASGVASVGERGAEVADTSHEVTQQRHRQTGFREGEGGGGTSETGVGQVV